MKADATEKGLEALIVAQMTGQQVAPSQLRYSEVDANTLDLALFVNGLPIAHYNFNYIIDAYALVIG